MKAVMIAAAMLFAPPVSAGPNSRVVDDFVTCLIGRSAVTLNAGASDATAAQQVAYERCDEPKEVTDNPESVDLYAPAVSAGPNSRVVDDLVACLIGQSAVALNTGASDATAAQQVAYERCDEPKEVTDNPESVDLYVYVNIMVEKMARPVNEELRENASFSENLHGDRN